MLTGALAAAVTPLRDGGHALDEAAFAPYVEFLAGHGIDGVLALGTTGEGFLLSPAERSRALSLVLEASAGRLQVAAHCGAQTTAGTVALVGDAVDLGADAVAVIAPPYFQLDGEALFAHFAAAARAAASTPFYVYEFERASGYAVPPTVVERLRDTLPNVVGLKVSDAPFARVAPYLLERMDVFVGAEALIHEGAAAGAAGAVSGLAAAFPERVAAVVRDPTSAGADELGRVRAAIERFPRHSALKHVLRRRGVPIAEDVRLPLRSLLEDERRELDEWFDAIAS